MHPMNIHDKLTINFHVMFIQGEKTPGGERQMKSLQSSLYDF